MSAKEWLRVNECPNRAIDSEVHTQHHTYMDKIMDEYAKEYMKLELNKMERSIRVNKFL